MIIETERLTGEALDWAVAKCEGWTPAPGPTLAKIWLQRTNKRGASDIAQVSKYSTRWELGGPIIEREGIEVLCNVSEQEARRFIKGTVADWFACAKYKKRLHYHGQTPLMAAMRCYVASKMGDEVDIPKELL